MNVLEQIRNITHRSPQTNGGIQKPTFKVFVGICTHRDIKVRVFKLLRMLEKCPDPKIVVHEQEGDALIDRSRSRLATKFLLERDEEILFFIDDDIIFDTLDITKMMWSMIKADLDILGGPYCTKEEKEPTFAIRTLDNQDEIVCGKNGAIEEVRYVSTGCMAIRRRVLEKMSQSGMVHLCHPKSLRFYPFFTPMEKLLSDRWIYLSEEWAFCQRAKQLGFKVWCDFSVKLGHIGTQVFSWDNFVMEKKNEYDELLYRVDTEKD